VQAIQEDELLGTAVTVYKGKLTYKAADALDLDYMPLELWKSHLFLSRVLQSTALSFIK
jgi:hypothetical protein